MNSRNVPGFNAQEPTAKTRLMSSMVEKDNSKKPLPIGITLHFAMGCHIFASLTRKSCTLIRGSPFDNKIRQCRFFLDSSNPA